MILVVWVEMFNLDFFEIDICFGDGMWIDGMVELLLNDLVILVCYFDFVLDGVENDLEVFS